MMETADFRNRDDRSSGRWRDGSGIWRVLRKPQMRPTLVVVPAVDREDASQMRLSGTVKQGCCACSTSARDAVCNTAFNSIRAWLSTNGVSTTRR